jgi:type IV pilus assembly protein PilE
MTYNHTNAPRLKKGAAISGFTLIEMMIVVAIIGILSAIALPSYRQYVLRGDRASARAAMMDAQQYMERYYAVNNTFATATLPARFASVPPESPKYSIAFGTAVTPSAVALSATAYALEATPSGTDTRCSVLWLKHTGEKGTSGTGTVAECWK